MQRNQQYRSDDQDEPGDPESVARTICLRLLAQRARTRVELAQALARRGVPDAAAEVVLDRFTEVGLIDDDALAQHIALAQHQQRGLAARAVTAKLRQRGVADSAIDTAVGLIDPDSEREAARALVAKKAPALRDLSPQTRTRRLVGMLSRRGYSASVAFDVVREVTMREVSHELPENLTGE